MNSPRSESDYLSLYNRPRGGGGVIEGRNRNCGQSPFGKFFTESATSLQSKLHGNCNVSQSVATENKINNLADSKRLGAVCTSLVLNNTL